MEVFYKPEWTKGGPYENEFWVFSNLEMNITVIKIKIVKTDRKKGSFV